MSICTFQASLDEFENNTKLFDLWRRKKTFTTSIAKGEEHKGAMCPVDQRVKHVGWGKEGD